MPFALTPGTYERARTRRMPATSSASVPSFSRTVVTWTRRSPRLLHDAVEDQGGLERLDDIRDRFGERVARIVEECSDSFETPKRPWRERKQQYLEHLEQASPEGLGVSLADKVYNARATLGDYHELGDQLWQRFNASRDEILWYYRALADEFARLRPGPLASELERNVSELEQLCPKSGVTPS